MIRPVVPKATFSGYLVHGLPENNDNGGWSLRLAVALELLRSFIVIQKNEQVCPICKSSNLEQVPIVEASLFTDENDPCKRDVKLKGVSIQCLDCGNNDVFYVELEQYDLPLFFF